MITEPRTIVRSYKLRIFPCAETIEKLNTLLYAAQQLYNYCLALKKRRWEESRKSISKFDLMKIAAAQRREVAEFLNIPIHSSVYENVAERCDRSYENFISGRAEFPRFAGRDFYNSVQYRKPGAVFHWAENTLTIPMIDKAVRWHDKGYEKKPITGTIKRLVILREKQQWYAILQCEEKNFVSSFPESRTKEPVGVDAGVYSYAVLSDGKEISAPRFLEQSLERLKKLSRTFSRQMRINNPQCFDEKGAIIKGKRFTVMSKRAERTKSRITALHKHIAEQRKYWLHHISNDLLREYETLVIEKLNIEAMLQDKTVPRKLTRAIQDASWYTFQQMLSYKADWHGRTVKKVEAAFTTRECSSCGNTVQAPIKSRVWTCPQCGTTHKRKSNAAKNVLEKSKKAALTE